MSASHLLFITLSYSSGEHFMVKLLRFKKKLSVYYLRQGGYVFIGVCLFVGLRKIYSTDFHNFGRKDTK